MQDNELTGWLDHGVDEGVDHVLGASSAPITLVEYGSYDCPHCRAANERIAEVRSRLGSRLRYVFRHRPLTGSDIARRAAELVETISDPERFWDAHVELMTRSKALTEEDLAVVADRIGLGRMPPEQAEERRRRAAARVEADVASARASGVRVTPTFFINGRRYDGPWDEVSFEGALIGSLGHRVSAAALDFASWAPGAGLLLLLATLLALAIANSPLGPAFEAFWHTELGFVFGGYALQMSLLHWIDDGLLTLFFLVVGLEIKRELSVGYLSSRRAAALPIAAALGGMAVPSLIYLLAIPDGPWAHGWGVPMATDTAFAIALVAVLGRRVPVELRIFLTAAAIADDIGAILVVAFFYSGALQPAWLGGALAITALLALLNQASIYRSSPYLLLGLALWACVLAGGLHPTLAGVVLALFIPTRPPPDYRTLLMQADNILAEEARHEGEQLRHGPSVAALRAIDAIHDRMESPADRMLRVAAPRSSYVVLPIFALANIGVAISVDVLHGHEPLIAAIVLGLVAGKPLGFLGASLLAVKLGLAEKPAAYSWRQLAGAGVLAGIGFTMSLFIAGQAFPVPADFAAAKIAILCASLLAASLGTTLLAFRKGTELSV